MQIRDLLAWMLYSLDVSIHEFHFPLSSDLSYDLFKSGSGAFVQVIDGQDITVRALLQLHT